MLGNANYEFHMEFKCKERKIYALSVILSTVAHMCISEITFYLRDLRSFVIRFDFESYVRFEIRFVVKVLFEIF